MNDKTDIILAALQVALCNQVIILKHIKKGYIIHNDISESIPLTEKAIKEIDHTLSRDKTNIGNADNSYRIKKPIVFKTEEFDQHGEHYQITRAYCPNCSNCDYVYAGVFGTIEDFRETYGYTDELPNYCPKCGQAWDWSEILNNENK